MNRKSTILPALMAGAILLTAAGCGAKQDQDAIILNDPEQSLPTVERAESENAAPAPVAAVPEEIPENDPAEQLISGFRVDYLGFQSFLDVDNDVAVRIYYDLTNCSDQTLSPSNVQVNLATTLYGEALATSRAGEEIPELDNVWLDVRPGVTTHCAAEFKAGDYDDPFDVSFFSVTPEDGITISVRDYPWVELENTFPSTRQIPDPDWTDGLPATGEITSGARAEIVGCMVLDLDDATKEALITVNFTNGGDTDTSLFMASYYRALQDGIQLPAPWVDPRLQDGGMTGDKDPLYQSIAPGKSISVELPFILRSESPVEFEFFDPTTNTPLIGETYHLN